MKLLSVKLGSLNFKTHGEHNAQLFPLYCLSFAFIECVSLVGLVLHFTTTETCTAVMQKKKKLFKLFSDNLIQ